MCRGFFLEGQDEMESAEPPDRLDEEREGASRPRREGQYVSQNVNLAWSKLVNTQVGCAMPAKVEKGDVSRLACAWSHTAVLRMIQAANNREWRLSGYQQPRDFNGAIRKMTE